MPQMADIVVKKDDAVTNITYTGMIPSNGETGPAIFKSASVGSTPAHQPEFRIASRDGDKGTKRSLRATYVYPQIATNTTTGITSVAEKAIASIDWSVPKSMTTNDIKEFSSQFANLIASTLIRQCVNQGYAPT